MSERVEKITAPEFGRLRARFGEGVLWLARHRWFLCLSPVALFLLTFFLFPFISLFRISLASNPGGTGYGEGTPFYVPGTWTIDNYIRFMTDEFFYDTAIFSVVFGLCICTISAVVSYIYAYQIYRSGPMMKMGLLLVVILSKFTNVLVLMYGLLVVFGRHGLLNKSLMYIGVLEQDKPLIMLFNWFGVLLGETILIMPYCVLVTAAVLHSIDDSLTEAAEGLGATRVRSFMEVTLPLSLPAIWVSVLLSFMWGVAAFISPYLLGKADLYTLAVLVDQQVNWRLNWAMGATVAFVLVGVVILVMYPYHWAQQKAAK